MFQNPGSDMEIFSAVMTLLKWPYKFVMSDNYGYTLPNGSWNGLVSMAMKDEIDISATSMRISPERLKVVDFGYPMIR